MVSLSKPGLGLCLLGTGASSLLSGCDSRDWDALFSETSAPVTVRVLDNSGTPVVGAAIQSLSGELLAQTRGPEGLARLTKPLGESLVYVKPPSDPLATPQQRLLKGQFLDLGQGARVYEVRLEAVRPLLVRELPEGVSEPEASRAGEPIASKAHRSESALPFVEVDLLEPSLDLVIEAPSAWPSRVGALEGESASADARSGQRRASSFGQGESFPTASNGDESEPGFPGSRDEDTTDQLPPLESPVGETLPGQSSEEERLEGSVPESPRQASAGENTGPRFEPSAGEIEKNLSPQGDQGAVLADQSNALAAGGRPLAADESKSKQGERASPGAEPRLPPSLSRMSSWGLDPARLRAVHLRVVSTEPRDVEFKIFALSGQKELELELGELSKEHSLHVLLPTAYGFDALRFESEVCGGGVVPLLSSSTESPQDLHCPETRAETLTTLGVRYPAYGLLRYFRGGQIEVGSGHLDVAAKLALFHVPQSLFEVTPPKSIPRVRYESSRSFGYDFGEDRVSSGQASHRSFVTINAELPKPKVAFVIEDGANLRLDQSLIGRFKRSLRAHFLSAKSLIPILPESLSRQAGYAFGPALVEDGWQGSAFDALVDYAISIEAEETGLLVSWFDRFGNKRSSTRLSYRRGEPPELFAKSTFEALMAHFPEQLRARVTRAGDTKSLLTLEGELQMGDLGRDDAFETYALRQGGLVPLGQATLRQGSDGSVVDRDGRVEFELSSSGIMEKALTVGQGEPYGVGEMLVLERASAPFTRQQTR